MMLIIRTSLLLALTALTLAAPAPPSEVSFDAGTVDIQASSPSIILESPKPIPNAEHLKIHHHSGWQVNPDHDYKTPRKIHHAREREAKIAYILENFEWEDILDAIRRTRSREGVRKDGRQGMTFWI